MEIRRNSKLVALLSCPGSILKGVDPRICLQSCPVYWFLLCWGSALPSKFSGVSASVSNSILSGEKAEAKVFVYFSQDWGSVGPRLKAQMWLKFFVMITVPVAHDLIPISVRLSSELWVLWLQHCISGETWGDRRTFLERGTCQETLFPPLPQCRRSELVAEVVTKAVSSWSFRGRNPSLEMSHPHALVIKSVINTGISFIIMRHIFPKTGVSRSALWEDE